MQVSHVGAVDEVGEVDCADGCLERVLAAGDDDRQDRVGGSVEVVGVGVVPVLGEAYVEVVGSFGVVELRVGVGGIGGDFHRSVVLVGVGWSDALGDEGNGCFHPRLIGDTCCDAGLLSCPHR